MGTDNHYIPYTPPIGIDALSRPKQASSSDDIDSSLSFIDSRSYIRAEKRAKWYLKEICSLAETAPFLNELMEDFQQWGKSTSSPFSSKTSLSSLEAQQQINHSLDSWSFLGKLYAEKKLKTYLRKSIRYIFLRDLGRDINEHSSNKKVNRIVSQLHRWIRKQLSETSRHSQDDQISTQWLFSKAKQAGVEDTFIWLMAKLSLVERKLPRQLDQTNGMRKLVKIIAGVVLHQVIELPENCTDMERKQKLESAIHLGYSYGLTYPLVDDLLDSASILDDSEKDDFNHAIRQSLLSGCVVDCPKFSQSNQSMMAFIYSELAEAFKCIKQNQSKDSAQLFFEQAYVFFEAQDIDRRRKLSRQTYSMKELFLPIILKSAGCRLIARDILCTRSDERFNHHTFCFGIYNQFNDDIKDIFDDLKEGNVTPYTYYLQRHQHENPNHLINPYRIYWAVVFYLIKDVYADQPKSKQLLLERSINAHKSMRSMVGDKTYLELTDSLLKTGNHVFDQTISRLVEQPNDVAWFDKLVSRQVSHYFEQKKTLQQAFKERYQEIKSFIEKVIEFKEHPNLNRSALVHGANYSLQAGGKRLRSVLAYSMSVDKYGFAPELTPPILQLLEYMHTASIIFDDKPSQDDANLRRGKPALHRQYQSEAMAELTGVFMMMRAVEVQSRSVGFDASRVLESLAYAASTTQAICEGQWLDLQSKNRAADMTDIEQLELICELKTGLAIEASLLIPAILAGEHDIDKGHIKLFAKHLGLAFQIKDDLLDHLGDSQVMGKPTLQDTSINKASFVTCLGVDGAQKELFKHYHLANESLDNLGNVKVFMGQILEFVVHRDS